MKNQYFFGFRGSKLERKIDQKSIRTWTPRRDAPKRVPRGFKTPPRRPKTPPRRSKTRPRRPKMPQDAPKMPPRRPKTRPRRPKTAPRRPQEARKAAQDAQDGGKIGSQKRSEAQSRPDFGFGTFWGGFWSVLGWIVERFRDGFLKFFAPQRVPSWLRLWIDFLITFEFFGVVSEWLTRFGDALNMLKNL